MGELILKKLAAVGNLDKIFEKPKAFCFLPSVNDFIKIILVLFKS